MDKILKRSIQLENKLKYYLEIMLEDNKYEIEISYNNIYECLYILENLRLELNNGKN